MATWWCGGGGANAPTGGGGWWVMGLRVATPLEAGLIGLPRLLLVKAVVAVTAAGFGLSRMYLLLLEGAEMT